MTNTFPLTDLWVALPELFLLSATLFILLLGVCFPKQTASKVVYVCTQLSLLVSFVLLVRQWHAGYMLIFNGMYVLDHLSVVLKCAICLCAFVAFIYASCMLQKHPVNTTHYYTLGLFSLLGMMVLVSAWHFIPLFLGLELFSLPLYAMIALHKEAIAIEAAIKYFIMGALASGIFLYGVSLLYGATNSLSVIQMGKIIATLSGPPTLILVFALVFIVVGLAFKLGVVPFHMWVPDVYEGAPAPVILFLGTAGKVAALALLLRVLTEGLSALSMHWHLMLMVLSVLSMALGNIAAIAQSNFKRMLAYSSIAHMGYMLLGLSVATKAGYGAALFYMISYALMTLAAFGLVSILQNAGYTTGDIADLSGLNARNPWLALLLLLTLFSLAGVPPLLGFMAKISVIEALIGAHFIWLAALAMLFAVIGVYYYIRVVKVMYFEEAQDSVSAPIHYTATERVALTTNGLLLLLLGIMPGGLFALCQQVF